VDSPAFDAQGRLYVTQSGARDTKSPIPLYRMGADAVREAVERARQTTSDVELAPQNSYVRRLQHQLVERHDMNARSTGNEPNRRLVILGAEE